MPTCSFFAAYILTKTATASTVTALQPTIASAVPLEISLFACGSEVSLVLVGVAVGAAVGVGGGVSVTVGLVDGVVVGSGIGVGVGFVVG